MTAHMCMSWVPWHCRWMTESHDVKHNGGWKSQRSAWSTVPKNIKRYRIEFSVLRVSAIFTSGTLSTPQSAPCWGYRPEHNVMIRRAPAMIRRVPAMIHKAQAMIHKAPVMIRRAPVIIRRAPVMIQSPSDDPQRPQKHTHKLNLIAWIKSHDLANTKQWLNNFTTEITEKRRKDLSLVETNIWNKSTGGMTYQTLMCLSSTAADRA